ncbi:MAG: FlgD immunoglobulin-like domain containing protein, partial [Candidatus Zixiibacteriota bacterium]
TPALLDVTYTASNGAADGLVQYGESFNLVVKLDNMGEAAVTSGTYRFTTGGIDLGLPDTTIGIIDADTTLIFFLTAPQFDTTAHIRFDITQRPLDVNSGQPAAFEDSSFVFTVQIVSGQAELQADAFQLSSKLVIPGSTEDLIRLDLKNQAMSPIWDMLMKTITLDFKDLDGQPLRARSVLEVGNCGLFLDDQKIAAATAGEDKLILYFDNFDIAASETRSVVLRLSFLGSLATSFRITMDTGAVEAEFIDPRVKLTQVPIITDSTGAMVINTSFASTGRTLQSSFLIENNPFDPTRDPARFSYVLSEPSAVELRIFTVTGELVHTQKLSLGAEGTSAGEQQFIEWDGRNDDGTMILNGIYVAQLYVRATDEQAQMKVAVVKR